MFNSRRLLFGLAAATLVLGLSVTLADQANAQSYGTHLYYGTSYPIYHGPTIYYDRLHTTPHWTPRRGWHVHTGHYYVPGYISRVPATRVYVGRRLVLP